jgi:hypothetical protein
MSEEQRIQWLPSTQIDRSKWDACIERASNGLIYGYSLYLDHMSRNWDGLVFDDYKAVMPLTWNKKYGFNYLYQPFLSAQLGIFGENLDSSLVKAFLHSVPKKFKFWDIYLNHGNIFNIENYPFYVRKNFVLHLDKPYPALSSHYKENIARNIKKAKQSGCRPKKDFEVEEIIELALHQMKTYAKRSGENVERFRSLYNDLKKKGQAMTYGITSPAEELLASAVFFYSHQRAYYILVGNDPRGKNLGASHALIDSFIEENEKTGLLLDFEGSDVESLGNFFKGFGASEENYAGIKYNKLPFFIKWIKR